MSWNPNKKSDSKSYKTYKSTNKNISSTIFDLSITVKFPHLTKDKLPTFVFSIISLTRRIITIVHSNKEYELWNCIVQNYRC